MGYKMYTDVYRGVLHVCTDSRSGVLYVPCLCLSLINCLTHVEYFRFFLTAITSSQHLHCKLQTTSAVQATTSLWRLCPTY